MYTENIIKLIFVLKTLRKSLEKAKQHLQSIMGPSSEHKSFIREILDSNYTERISLADQCIEKIDRILEIIDEVVEGDIDESQLKNCKERFKYQSLGDLNKYVYDIDIHSKTLTFHPSFAITDSEKKLKSEYSENIKFIRGSLKRIAGK